MSEGKNKQTNKKQQQQTTETAKLCSGYCIQCKSDRCHNHLRPDITVMVDWGKTPSYLLTTITIVIGSAKKTDGRYYPCKAGYVFSLIQQTDCFGRKCIYRLSTFRNCIILKTWHNWFIAKSPTKTHNLFFDDREKWFRTVGGRKRRLSDCFDW